MDTTAAHALIRFGLGRRGAEAPPGDPHAWLTEQLDGPDRATFPATLPNTSDGLILLREQNRLQLPGNALIQPVLQQEYRVHTNELLTSAAPFRERLVWFWANHFTVSLRAGGGITATIGPYLREAIRPNVTQPFAAMLLAVMRHPAMLMYLDQTNSVGPNSANGLRSHRGLNENLARECMELHTLSPASGYSQADVTAFAAVLTGWTVETSGTVQGFVFRPGDHEPGDKTIMGRTFPPGEIGGLMALEFLASHPATHKHLATRLVRHFVADDPPPDAVRTIEGVLRDTNGHLGAAARALVTLPAAWQPLTKFRSPQDYAVAALRLLDLPEDKRPPLQNVLGTLGQPMWNAPLPNGWGDQASEWSGPETAMRRVDWAFEMSARAGGADPAALAEAALGPLLRPGTLDALRGAGSRRDGVTMLLASPEFSRR